MNPFSKSFFNISSLFQMSVIAIAAVVLYNAFGSRARKTLVLPFAGAKDAEFPDYTSQGSTGDIDGFDEE